MNNNIAAIRKARGLTQAQLAESIGVRRPHLARYETQGIDKMSLGRAVIIAEALNCTVNDLIADPDKERK